MWQQMFRKPEEAHMYDTKTPSVSPQDSHNYLKHNQNQCWVNQNPRLTSKSSCKPQKHPQCFLGGKLDLYLGLPQPTVGSNYRTL